jgi:hypothetical protein
MGLTVTGKEHVTVTFDQMRSKLFNLDQIRERLGKTEPMKGVAFTVGNAVRFRAEPGWNHGIKAIDGTDTIPVFVALGRGRYTTEYRLTKNCLQETCMAFGFKREYTESCPAELLIPHMNYWFREGLYGKGRKKTDFQFLTNSDTATAFTRQSLTPFSNLSLLEQALAGIEAKFGTGTEVLADYKFSHTLRQTSLRLIVPEANATLHGTGTDNDTWSMGVQIRNSLTGASQTSLEGYLFRWVCTNGQIDTRASSGVWTRRPTATEDEVYAWARQAVDEALSGLDGAFDAVQSLTGPAHRGIAGRHPARRLRALPHPDHPAREDHQAHRRAPRRGHHVRDHERHHAGRQRDRPGGFHRRQPDARRRGSALHR